MGLALVQHRLRGAPPQVAADAEDHPGEQQLPEQDGRRDEPGLEHLSRGEGDCRRHRRQHHPVELADGGVRQHRALVLERPGAAPERCVERGALHAVDGDGFGEHVAALVGDRHPDALDPRQLLREVVHRAEPVAHHDDGEG